METTFEAIERGHSALARERIVADLKTLTHDAEDLLKATAHDLSDKTKDARERFGAALERAKTTCIHLQEQTAAMTRKADTVVREHPYESIGMAFGLGVLFGVLVTRR